MWFRFARLARSALLAMALVALAPVAGGGAANAGESLTPQQKQEVEDILRNYILNNPEVVLEAVRAFRAKQEAKTRDQAQQRLQSLRGELQGAATSPVGGNPKGNVTVVEFFDYQCGFCKRVFPSVVKLLDEDVNIRWVFREFPILGPQSRIAARAALAIWNTERQRYVPFHTALMRTKGGLNEDRILGTAAKVGIDVEKLKKAMQDPAVDKELRRNFEIAEALNINGTPTFIIGKQVVPGAIDLATMKRMIADARANCAGAMC